MPKRSIDASDSQFHMRFNSGLKALIVSAMAVVCAVDHTLDEAVFCRDGGNCLNEENDCATEK